MDKTAIIDKNLIFRQMSDHALVEASDIISSITGVRLQVEVVFQGYMDLPQMLRLFDESEPLTVAVSQKLQGVLNGHAILLLKDDACLPLVRELLMEKARLRELTEMEEEGLLEIANIIINSCSSHYAEMLNGRVESHLPDLLRLHYSQLLQLYAHEIQDTGIFCIGLRIVTPAQVTNANILWTGLSWND
jgi:chemotaxis protein CheY-P-specific phosphatase CheC